MLKIRLFRTGKKNQPFFKIIVVDKGKSSRAGRFVEEVGFYNPLTKEKSLKGDRIKYWISVGARPSETIHNLLIEEKIIEGEKVAAHKKSKKTEEKEEGPAKETVVPEKTEEKLTEEIKQEEKSAEPEKSSEQKQEKETAEGEIKKETKEEVKEKPSGEREEEKPKEEPAAEKQTEEIDKQSK